MPGIAKRLLEGLSYFQVLFWTVGLVSTVLPTILGVISGLPLWSLVLVAGASGIVMELFAYCGIKLWERFDDRASPLKLSFNESDAGCVRNNTVINKLESLPSGASWQKPEVCVWYRLRVDNSSHAPVTGAKAKLLSIEKNGSVVFEGEDVDLFFARREEPDTQNKTIQRGVPAYIDVAYVMQIGNAICMPVDPGRHSSSIYWDEIFDGAGVYTFNVVVVSSARVSAGSATFEWLGEK